jgi:hypothetical protein
MITKEKPKQKNDLDANISKIYCRLANPENFKENLDNMPHEKVLDMLLIYYVRINIMYGEFLSVMINNKLMDSWNINENQLRDIAWCNTIRDNPAVCKPLREALIELGVAPETEERRVYIISNEKKYMGAVCIAYPGFLDRIGSSLKSDFYILPSSVHECLILPCDENLDTSSLRETVKNINRTELKKKDILSNSVYRYSRARRRLVIDNS